MYGALFLPQNSSLATKVDNGSLTVTKDRAKCEGRHESQAG